MNALPPRGLPESEVFRLMEQARQRDMPWRGGRVWAYVYDPGPEIEALQKRAFLEFLGENALDPTVFPSLLQFENEVVAIAARHLGGGPEVVGNFTSGGTESVLLAVKTARDWARVNRRLTGKPEMVLPITAHACFHKAAQYFDVEARVTPVRGDYRADVEAMRRAMGPNTVLLVGSAPSYAHGVVDPISEIASLALEHGVLCHVDGCIGGFLLPWFARLGAPVPPFDFSVPGVTSISMDFHKYAFCPKGASVVLYRDKGLRKHQIFACSSWTGYTVVNTTIQSTKSGGPVAATWATLHAIGEEGYLHRARDMLEATRRLVAGIRKIPELYLLAEPDMTLIAFGSRTVSPFHLVDEMKERGWYVQPQLGLHGTPENVHLSVTPASLAHVDAFLADLADSLESSRKLAWGPLVRQLERRLSGMDADSLDEGAISEMLALAGVRGDALPGRLADINRVMNSLSPRLAEKLLRAYLNELYSPPAAPGGNGASAGATLRSAARRAREGDWLGAGTSLLLGVKRGVEALRRRGGPTP